MNYRLLVTWDIDLEKRRSAPVTDHFIGLTREEALVLEEAYNNKKDVISVKIEGDKNV